MTRRIEDHAVVGDCRSAALVARDGTIDWLCWPRFDSPSLFGALLDPEGGAWRLAPAGPYEAQRGYVGDTNVLATVFETPTGRLRLYDLMPVACEEDKRRRLIPQHELLRLAVCEHGVVDVEMCFEPRPGFGRAARFDDAGALGLRVCTTGGTAVLRSSVRLDASDGGARARVRLGAGEEWHASLTWADEAPAVLPPLGLRSHQALARTLSWWQAWAARCRYRGAHRDRVVRSALTLKLLAYAPSGAVVAAATTSLPERIGGPLNWDYRFCWLRDASLTVRALIGLGYHDEAEAFVSWLLHSTRLTRPRLNVLYDVFGNLPPRERMLSGWHGYLGSAPVRIGNAAADQLQLDVYGEVIDATARLAHVTRFDTETARMLVGFGEYVCRHWHEPDEGIWEPRSGRAPHTHSRVLSWAALDGLLRLDEAGLLRGLPRARVAAARAAIARHIEMRCWNPRLESYVATVDGSDLDATLLLLSWYGFADPRSPRMRGTWRRVRETLGAGDGLLYRYCDGDTAGEGAFGVCGFWAVEYLALGGGTADEAARRLDDLVGYANDVGLFAEEIDPASGAALGNFPQAFTHVGLVNAALTLERRRAAARGEAVAEVRA